MTSVAPTSSAESSDGLMWAVRKVDAASGFQLVRVPIPTPRADQVLIKVLACSLCGTDVHVHDWDPPFCQGRLTPPITTGHEVCGQVIGVGLEVTTLAIGDLVSAESHIPCKSQPQRGLDKQCHMCQTGNEHICSFVQFFSVDVDGFLAEYAVAAANILWKNDGPARNMPWEIQAMQESLGNSVYTVDVSNVRGKDVAVFGLGPTGLNAVGVSRALGARSVIAVAGTPEHIAIAQQMGATHILDRHKVDVVAEIRKLTDGRGAGVCLEMSGSTAALDQCLDAVMTTGQVSILGLYNSPVTIDMSKKVVLKDVTVRGVYGRRIWSTWQLTQQLLVEGKLDVTPVITQRFDGLRDWEVAIKAMHTGTCGKCVFFPHGCARHTNANANPIQTPTSTPTQLQHHPPCPHEHEHEA